MAWFDKFLGAKLETPEEAIRRGQMARGPASPPSIPRTTKPPASKHFSSRTNQEPSPPPLPPKQEVQDDEETPRALHATFHPQAFSAWVEAVDKQLVKGFTELQRHALATKVGRLRVDDCVVMHYQFFQSGSPSGLRLSITRTAPELLAVRVDGLGPAMDVMQEQFQSRAGIFGELVLTDQRQLRDGRFRRDTDGLQWHARLPIQAGTILDLPFEIIVEHGRPGIIGGGEIWETPLLKELLPIFPALFAEAESRLLEASAKAPIPRASLMPPEVILSSRIVNESEWFIRLAQREGTSSNWRVDFLGTDCLGVRREA